MQVTEKEFHKIVDLQHDTYTYGCMDNIKSSETEFNYKPFLEIESLEPFYIWFQTHPNIFQVLIK